MERFNPIIGDPLAESATLLRRLAFVLLFLVMPVAAVLGRRALVIIVPVAVALLVISALLDGNRLPLTQSLKRFFFSPATLVGLLLFAWSALSLLWSPFPAGGMERLSDTALTIAMIFCGYLALPERMRSPNLYLLPLGVGIAAFLALAAEFFLLPGRQSAEFSDVFQRGLQVVVLLFWPSFAWLRSRHRDILAVSLVIVLVAALVCAPERDSVVAFAIGAAGYVSVMVFKARAVQWIARIAAGLIAFAPLLPFVLYPIAAATGSVPFISWLRIGRRVLLSEPMQVISGQGFESASLPQAAHVLGSLAPTSILFKLWYELGIVGAWSAAALILLTIGRVGARHVPLAPGITAGFLSAYVFSCIHYGATQAWWTTALTCTVLVFIALTRGQYRTIRPRIFVVR